jgi:hypothetical protein
MDDRPNQGGNENGEARIGMKMETNAVETDDIDFFQSLAIFICGVNFLVFFFGHRKFPQGEEPNLKRCTSKVRMSCASVYAMGADA